MTGGVVIGGTVGNGNGVGPVAHEAISVESAAATSKCLRFQTYTAILRLPIARAVTSAPLTRFDIFITRTAFLIAYDRQARPMKVRSSLKSLKNRHRDCKVVRRKGRVYVINKTDPRFKAKQG